MSYGEDMELPVFPNHILGELEEEDKKGNKVEEGKKSEKEKDKKKKKTCILGHIHHPLLVCPKNTTLKNPKRGQEKTRSLKRWKLLKCLWRTDLGKFWT